MYQDSQLLIDGAWCTAASGRTHPVVNPATGQPIGTFAYAERADLDRALEPRDKGFKAWRKVSALRALQDHAQGREPAARARSTRRDAA